MEGSVQLPPQAVGTCQRAVHLFWAPLCRLAFVAIASLTAARGVPNGALDKVAVAAVSVGETRTRESAIIIAKPGPIDELLQGAYSCHPR